MNRFDRADSPTEAQEEALPTPDLPSSVQSPQSSMLPSTSASTVDEPVHSPPSTSKTQTSATEGVSIEEIAS